MRFFNVFLVLIFLFSLMTLQDVNADIGIGPIIGDPTGISLKIDKSLVFGIGWSLSEKLDIHCDYWLRNDHLKNSFYWYIGIGGKIHIRDTNPKKNEKGFGLGVRVPVGLQYLIDKQFELFGEIVPGITLLPATGADIDAGLGLRFHF